MSAFDYQRTIFAYHGCDRLVAERILSGGEFCQSDNDYDWLGRGIYFWEYGPRGRRSGRKINTSVIPPKSPLLRPWEP